MTVIRAETEINATPDKVWEIISDLDNEPKFWKGTKEVRNISRDGNEIIREITIAFKDKKCMQKITLFPKDRIEAIFTKGILDGKKLMISTRRDGGVLLEAVWDIRLSGMMGMFTGMLTKHIRNGTMLALENIKEEAER